MTKENPARTTTLFAVQNSKNVSINSEKISQLARNWAEKKVKVPKWEFNLHLSSKNAVKQLDYLVILDALNFCFWSKNKKNKWMINYQKKWIGGYFALSLALRRFFENSDHRLSYFQKISFSEFKEIFTGRNKMPFLEKRWQIAKSVSNYVVENYGSALSLVKSARQDIGNLVLKISKIPFFGDFGFYKGKKIYFLKRAQILAGDIWGVFNGKGIGFFKNPGYLTAFADYKIPQILKHYGILEYSQKLEKAIKSKKEIKPGSALEIEIRSASIQAVEKLEAELKKLKMKFLPLQIDWILWNESKNIKIANSHHLTKTIFY